MLCCCEKITLHLCLDFWKRKSKRAWLSQKSLIYVICYHTPKENQVCNQEISKHALVAIFENHLRGVFLIKYLY